MFVSIWHGGGLGRGGMGGGAPCSTPRRLAAAQPRWRIMRMESGGRGGRPPQGNDG